tara:strand:+ start:8343 stop:8699 length:357 start_codon:yes stop_codon:yes gene_type:complete
MYQLTEDNFFLYAMKSYNNPNCKGMDEFKDDLKKFSYVKRLLKKTRNKNGLKERLIINHIIVIYNLFGSEAATKMLFFKIDKLFWPQLKSFLIFLNFMPPDNMLVVQDEALLIFLREI